MALSLRAWRLAKEFSQQEMADAIGVSLPTYKKKEADTDLISIGEAKLAAEKLGVSIEDINFFVLTDTECIETECNEVE